MIILELSVFGLSGNQGKIYINMSSTFCSILLLYFHPYHLYLHVQALVLIFSFQRRVSQTSGIIVLWSDNAHCHKRCSGDPGRRLDQISACTWVRSHIPFWPSPCFITCAYVVPLAQIALPHSPPSAPTRHCSHAYACKSLGQPCCRAPMSRSSQLQRAL